MDILAIEDDDGFRTEHPWPADRTALANTDFVEICEHAHDQARTTAIAAGTFTPAPTS